MANCAEMQALLSAYLDGELSGAESVRVQRHVASCPVCANELCDLEETSRLLRSLPDADPPETIRPGLRRRLRRKSAPTVAVAFLVLIAIVPTVAMSVSLLGAALPFWARAGFAVSTFSFAAGLAVLIFHLLRDVRRLVLYGYLYGGGR